MAALLDRTPNRSLRHHLLRLVEALLIPRSARVSDQAAQAAHANATAFVEAGGVMLAVDLVAGGQIGKVTKWHLLQCACLPQQPSPSSLRGCTSSAPA
jgi:hypothetical protein